MNIREYVNEINEKLKQYSDESMDVEYQRSIETEIMRILCKLYILYDKEFENKNKKFYIIKNNDQFIFINNTPFELIYNNKNTNIDEYINKIPKIKEIIRIVNHIIDLVNFYSDDTYFSLLLEETEGNKILLSFQNRFWLPEVHKKLNHIEGL